MLKSFDMEYLRIGYILKPHGIRGAIKVLPITDDPERYRGLNNAYIEQDGRFTPVKINVERIDADAVYLYVAGYPTIEAVEKIRNAYICVDRQDAVSLPQNTWFICDLEGMDVYAGELHIGQLKEVLQTGGIDVYRIQCKDGRRMMMPALKRAIISVDVGTRRMELDEKALSEVCVYED